MQTKTYGVRYNGNHVWTPSDYCALTADDVGKWIVFSPDNDGISMATTREAAIADAARTCGMTIEEFTADNFDPVECDVDEDSILTGQVEEITDAE